MSEVLKCGRRRSIRFRGGVAGQQRAVRFNALWSGTRSAGGRRSPGGLALGLVALSALAFAAPAEAQTTITPPGAVQGFRVAAGDGRVRVNWTTPSLEETGVVVTDLLYEYRYAPGTAVPDETAWSTPSALPPFGTIILDGLANGTAYAFEVRARNTAGPGPAETATVTPMRAACPAPALGGRRQIWRATLTLGTGVDDDGYPALFGYRDLFSTGMLSNTGFRVGTSRYLIAALYAYPPNVAFFPGSLTFGL